MSTMLHDRPALDRVLSRAASAALLGVLTTPVGTAERWSALCALADVQESVAATVAEPLRTSWLSAARRTRQERDVLYARLATPPWLAA